MENTRDNLFMILADCIGKKHSDIEPDMELEEDLGLDSVAFVELILRLEEEYKFDFFEFDEISHHVKTVGDFLAYIEGYIGRLDR